MPAAPPSTPRPTADPLVALADRCVQCGLCLPACPTYAASRLETESPRGRIALTRAWADGQAEPTQEGDAHLDHCLGCRTCEAVCPAGVEYGAFLVEARKQQRARRAPTWRVRALEMLAARPAALSTLLGFYRIAYPLLPSRMRPLPRPPARRTSPSRSTPVTPRQVVAVLSGCVARPYEAGTREALARLCATIDIQVVAPKGQTCCGTLHAHAGDAAAAETLARRNRQAFAGIDTVLTLASGCHDALASAIEGRAVDAIGFLAGHADRLQLRRLEARVGLHLPCTQRNVTRSVGAMHRLLACVPGLDVVTLDAGTGCCGAAGTGMLEDPEHANGFRAPLIAQIEASGVDCVISANIGCRLHLANASPVPVKHPLELLADQLERAPSPGTGARPR